MNSSQEQPSGAIAELFGVEITPSVWRTFVEKHTFPIREGRSHSFVFHGHARAVKLRHWIYGLPSSQAFHQINGSDFWYLTLDLPRDSRVEYKLEVHREGREEWIEDPLNPHRARDPYGANSVCHAEGYEVPDWIHESDDSPKGSLHDFVIPSSAYDDVRQVTLYQPARYRKARRYPLLIVHDGPDYIQYANMKTVLDNLMHFGDIPRTVVAFLHPRERLIEYADDKRHATYLTQELLPRLQKEFPLREDPRSIALMGASFGAVAALSTAWHFPETYGRLLLQSGSFAFSDIGPHSRSEQFDPVVRFMNKVRRHPKRISEKVFISCGVYESLIYENRSLIPILQSTNMDVRYVESRDGHNWENWRDRIREGLSWLFPGPLWMMYE